MYFGMFLKTTKCSQLNRFFLLFHVCTECVWVCPRSMFWTVVNIIIQGHDLTFVLITPHNRWWSRVPTIPLYRHAQPPYESHNCICSRSAPVNHVNNSEWVHKHGLRQFGRRSSRSSCWHFAFADSLHDHHWL